MVAIDCEIGGSDNFWVVFSSRKLCVVRRRSEFNLRHILQMSPVAQALRHKLCAVAGEGTGQAGTSSMSKLKAKLWYLVS